jgi:hypothetical protein
VAAAAPGGESSSLGSKYATLERRDPVAGRRLGVSEQAAQRIDTALPVDASRKPAEARPPAEPDRRSSPSGGVPGHPGAWDRLISSTVTFLGSSPTRRLG